MNGLRRINLEQAINVRDLGGYPTPDGCTPYERFIRAEGHGTEGHAEYPLQGGDLRRTVLHEFAVAAASRMGSRA